MGVGVLVGVRSWGYMSVMREPCHTSCHMKRAQTVCSADQKLSKHICYYLIFTTALVRKRQFHEEGKGSSQIVSYQVPWEGTNHSGSSNGRDNGNVSSCLRSDRLNSEHSARRRGST